MRQKARIGPNGLPYLLFEPEYLEPPYPLILFLHGSGERGSDLEDLEKVRLRGLPNKLEREPLPFMVVSPQCPDDSWWTLELDRLEALLDDVLREYPADPNRVCLTGMSMGGYGAWHLALRAPERFAALAPVCGGGITPLAHKLRDLPIWAFHGSEDQVVPLAESASMVEAVNAVGGRAKLTVFEGVGHNSWNPAYEDPELFVWLSSQRRG